MISPRRSAKSSSVRRPRSPSRASPPVDSERCRWRRASASPCPAPSFLPALPARRRKSARRLACDLALKVLESAVGPRTTVQSPLRWNDDGDWKLDYNNLERMPPEEVAKRRAEFDKVKQTA